LNLRDVGGIPAADGQVRRGVLLRSGVAPRHGGRRGEHRGPERRTWWMRPFAIYRIVAGSVRDLV
jgi:hypothetical protein